MAAADELRRALADRYAIERELGQGGMATVYLAQDLRHQRKVALKVLRPEIAATLGAERFHREIQIAAQLQHPNILPVHDSGEAAGFLYYVMPFVEGNSLRERLAKEDELPVPEAARILRDVADALSAAHAKGVVHRDIKPENVLLTGRHALVADFGVAKAVSEATGRQTLTTAGVALGTPTYMAPEQAAASPHMDHRVDIYALGVMGYEMLTGQPPFTAATPQMVLSAHVTEAPVEVTQRRATVPQPLAQLIMRCLEKKAADRPQTADELLPVLDLLATPSGGITPTQTQPVAAVAPRRRVVGVVGAVVVLVAIGAIAAQLLRSKPLSITVSDLTQVTSAPGVEFQPALSPDGKEVAYVTGPIGAPHVAVRSTMTAAGGGEVRLSDTSFSAAWIPNWSSDGAVVRFGGCRPTGCVWNETGKLGGAVRPSTLPPRTANRFVAWSADGARFAYFVAESLFVGSTADTTAPRRVAVHPGRVWGPHSLVWSPDGRWIAYVNGNTNWVTSGNVSASSIWIASAGGGTPQRITTEEHLNVSPAWLDERHLLFVSNQDGARGVYIVQVGPGGARGVPRIIPGVADPHDISYSMASRQLAWSKFTLRQNIWSYPLDRAAPVSIRDGVRVTTGNVVSEVADVSPDGKWLAYDSNLRGNMDLYKMPLAGGEAVPLTDAPLDEWDPRWSPDGTEIAFYADVRRSEEPSSAIMLISASGGKSIALSSGPGINDFPVWSPDGLHIAFFSTRTTPGEVWLLSRDSVRGAWHPEVQLTDSGGAAQDWAPDGSGVLCNWGHRLWLVSPEKRVLWRRDIAATSHLVGWNLIRYSRDGRMLYTVGTHRDGRTGIWAIPARGGEARLVVAANDPAKVISIGALSIGRDRLYVAVSEYESDIWVAKLRW
ncbi:MAG: protein kinase [Gemmatimonadales bacterium]